MIQIYNYCQVQYLLFLIIKLCYTFFFCYRFLKDLFIYFIVLLNYVCMCMWVPVFLDAEMLGCPEAGVRGAYRPLVSSVGDWNQTQVLSISPAHTRDFLFFVFD